MPNEKRLITNPDDRQVYAFPEVEVKVSEAIDIEALK